MNKKDQDDFFFTYKSAIEYEKLLLIYLIMGQMKPWVAMMSPFYQNSIYVSAWPLDLYI